MSRFKLLVLSVLSFSLLIVAIYIRSLFLPVDSQSTDQKKIIIRKGASITSIANTLYQNSLIRSPFAFKLAIKKLGIANKIQAGSFLLSPSQSPKEIALSLTTGRLDQWITIPEGFRNEQIAEILEKNLDISSSEFLSSAKGMQGKLFPDTYLIPLYSTAQEIVKIFSRNYLKKIEPLRSAIEKNDLTEDQILTPASLVERETLSDSEKPIVAGILLKRFQNDWPLQVDATIQYILGDKSEWWPIPTVSDRKIKSPYNTYLNLGLPPTPIANPGLASIKAVLHPATTEFWFYLHDKGGNIHYAKTIEQHQQNIQKYIY